MTAELSRRVAVVTRINRDVFFIFFPHSISMYWGKPTPPQVSSVFVRNEETVARCLIARYASHEAERIPEIDAHTE